MIVAAEEAAVANVLDEWRARQLLAETGSTLTGSYLDDVGRRALVARFVPVVKGLVDVGWIEVRESSPESGGETSLAGDELDRALMDPGSWIWRSDLSVRQLWLSTTDRWDELIDASDMDSK